MSILSPLAYVKLFLVTLTGIFLSVTGSLALEQAALNYKSNYDTHNELKFKKVNILEELKESQRTQEVWLKQRDSEIKKELEPLVAELKRLKAQKVEFFDKPTKPKEMIQLEKQVLLKSDLLEGILKENADLQRYLEIKKGQVKELSSFLDDKEKTILNITAEASRFERLIDTLESPNGINSAQIKIVWKDILASFNANNFEARYEFFKKDFTNVINERNSIISNRGDFRQVPQGNAYLLWDIQKSEPFDLEGFLENDFYRLPALKVLSVSINHKTFAKLGSIISLDDIESDSSWDAGIENAYTECITQSQISNPISNLQWLYDLCTHLYPEVAFLDLKDTEELYGAGSGSLLLSAAAAFEVSNLFRDLEEDLKIITQNQLPEKFAPWLSNYLDEKTLESKNRLETAISLKLDTVEKLQRAQEKHVDAEVKIDVNVKNLKSLKKDILSTNKRLSEMDDSYLAALQETERQNEELKQKSRNQQKLVELEIAETRDRITKSFQGKLSENLKNIRNLKDKIEKLEATIETNFISKQVALDAFLNSLEQDFLATNLDTQTTANKSYGKFELCFEASTPADVFLSVSDVKNIYFKGQVVPPALLDSFLHSKGWLRPKFKNKYNETIYGINGAYDQGTCPTILDVWIRGAVARWFENAGGFSENAADWQFDFDIRISKFDHFKANSNSFYKEQAPANLKMFFAAEVKDVEQGTSRFVVSPNKKVEASSNKTQNAVSEKQPQSAQLLQLGVSSDVKKIQSMLRQLGYYKSSIDGLWGPGSQAALQNFKMMKNLPNTLIWDLETQNLIMQLTNATD
ncbi:peptidoglycan-binding protein [Rhodobacteraceae bacterium]|nr:peptidoglycan-binding protein [Paracoccaceae bacterium]